jgi:hypothetical protein
MAKIYAAEHWLRLRTLCVPVRNSCTYIRLVAGGAVYHDHCNDELPSFREAAKD